MPQPPESKPVSKIIKKKHKFSLTFDFNRKSHAIYHSYISVGNMFISCILTLNRRQSDVKWKSILNRMFIFCPPIDAFNHFNEIKRTPKRDYFRCIHNLQI